MAYDLSTYAGRQQARDEAAAAGRNVVVDASGIYDRGTGQTTAGNNAGGVAITGGSPAVSSNEQAVLDAFKASSGLSIKDLNERTRQFNETLAFQKQQWEQAGLPAAEVARRVQEAQIAEIQNQIAMAQANVSGVYNGAPTEAARQFNARTGLDYLTQAAQMGGPADWAQLSNFYRGAQGNPQIPVFLSALQKGVTMPAFGAMGSSAPTVQSPDAIAQRLTGMPTQGGTNMDQTLGLFSAIGRSGGTGLAPQAIEQLNPDELAMFGSGIKAAGFSMPTFLSSYRASRIGQNAAVPLG